VETVESVLESLRKCVRNMKVAKTLESECMAGRTRKLYITAAGKVIQLTFVIGSFKHILKEFLAPRQVIDLVPENSDNH